MFFQCFAKIDKLDVLNTTRSCCVGRSATMVRLVPCIRTAFHYVHDDWCVVLAESTCQVRGQTPATRATGHSIGACSVLVVVGCPSAAAHPDLVSFLLVRTLNEQRGATGARCVLQRDRGLCACPKLTLCPPSQPQASHCFTRRSKLGCQPCRRQLLHFRNDCRSVRAVVQLCGCM